MTVIRSPIYVSDLQSLSRRSPHLLGAVDRIEQEIAALVRTMETPLFDEVVDILVQNGTLIWVEGKEYVLRSKKVEGIQARIALLQDIETIFAIAIEQSVGAMERE